MIPLAFGSGEAGVTLMGGVAISSVQCVACGQTALACISARSSPNSHFPRSSDVVQRSKSVTAKSGQTFAGELAKVERELQ